MAEPTPLTVFTIDSLYPSDGTELTFEAADASNGNSYVSTGREIVLMENTDSGGHTVVFTSETDASGRTGDLTVNLDAAERDAVMLAIRGWRNADRTVVMMADDASVTLCVVRLPTG